MKIVKRIAPLAHARWVDMLRELYGFHAPEECGSRAPTCKDCYYCAYDGDIPKAVCMLTKEEMDPDTPACDMMRYDEYNLRPCKMCRRYMRRYSHLNFVDGAIVDAMVAAVLDVEDKVRR